MKRGVDRALVAIPTDDGSGTIGGPIDAALAAWHVLQHARRRRIGA